jgi:hypothetical protein
MRLFVVILFSLVGLVSCSTRIEHTQISVRSLQKLDGQSITKAQYWERIDQPQAVPKQPIVLPFRMVAGVPVVEASVQSGKSVPMILDTGATLSMISADLALNQKVAVLRPEDVNLKIQGVLGVEQGRLGLLESLALGDWRIPNLPCLVRTYEYRFSRSHLAQVPDSLLGFDIASLRCSYLTLDYVSGMVTFGFGAPYQKQPRRSTEWAPLRIQKGLPLITIRSGKHQWEAVLDSGSFNGIEINEEIATKLGVQDQGVKLPFRHLMGVGGTLTTTQVNMRTVTLPQASLLGRKYAHVEMDIAPGRPRVGSLFLKNSVVTFDFRQKRLWIER